MAHRVWAKGSIIEAGSADAKKADETCRNINMVARDLLLASNHAHCIQGLGVDTQRSGLLQFRDSMLIWIDQLEHWTAELTDVIGETNIVGGKGVDSE